jgi:lysozyme
MLPRGVSRLPGIDVSKWQGDIDWQKVHNDGIRFVIARATRGNVVTDPKYAAYRHRAPAAGLRFTAYHYAMPSGRARDAEKEATHFLRVAKLHKGNIVPALDLEDSGGLSRKRLVAWVGEWVAKVRAKTGVSPMIYSSPSFWRDRLGDTNRFARGGVRLWVAHWNVAKPDVPAGNWSGHGWTFWQHSDCGSVKGITGCVDEDRLSAGRFKGVTIP